MHGGTKGKGKGSGEGWPRWRQMEWIYPFKRVLTLRILGLDAQNQLKLERWKRGGAGKMTEGESVAPRNHLMGLV